MMQQTYGKRYNPCMDMFKGLACLCVVTMHAEFPGTLGIAVQCMGRFCVPFFFMVPGYFCYRIGVSGPKSSPPGTHRRKIRHIATILVWSSLLYFPFGALWALLGIEPVTLSLKGLVVWAVFNQPLVLTSQMWFLFALLYVYIAYAVLDQFSLQKFCLPLALVLFVVYFFMAQGMHLLGYFIPNYLYKNWLVEGLPYFLLGYYLHQKEQKGALQKFSNGFLLAALLLSTLLCLAERSVMGRDFGVNIMSLPQLLAIFLLAIKNSSFGQGTLQRIGKNYSMFVYILHPFVWKVTVQLYDLVGIGGNMAALYLMPVLVCLVTLMLSAVVVRIKKQKETTQ